MIDLPAIRALRESTTPWHMSLRDTPLRADPEQLYRLLIIVSPGANTVRFMAPVRGTLGADALLAALSDAMLQPDGELVAARPPSIYVDDVALLDAIALPMSGCGVEVEQREVLDGIEPLMAMLAEQENLFSVAGQQPPSQQAPSAAPSDEQVLPLLLDADHTMEVESVAGRPCLVVRVEPRELEATRRIFKALDALAFDRRMADERAIEVIFALRGDRDVAVLSVFGITDDRPTLAHALGESDDVTVLLCAPDARPEGDEGAIVLTRVSPPAPL